MSDEQYIEMLEDMLDYLLYEEDPNFEDTVEKYRNAQGRYYFET